MVSSIKTLLLTRETVYTTVTNYVNLSKALSAMARTSLPANLFLISWSESKYAYLYIERERERKKERERVCVCVFVFYRLSDRFWPLENAPFLYRRNSPTSTSLAIRLIVQIVEIMCLYESFVEYTYILIVLIVMKIFL